MSKPTIGKDEQARRYEEEMIRTRALRNAAAAEMPLGRNLRAVPDLPPLTQAQVARRDRGRRKGRQARDASIAQVDEHAAKAWRAAALQAVRYLCATEAEFTTDDVWDYMHRMHPALLTHEPRAMGAVMQAAARARLCEATDRTRQSGRPDCHARPVRIWRPLHHLPVRT